MSYGETKKGKASASDEWTTPDDLVEAIRCEYGPIILDVAATAENAVAPRYFTKEQDALKQDWVGDLNEPGINFCNPPYSAPNKPLFTRKSIETARKGRTGVMVLPANTRDRWFHQLIFSGVRGGAAERDLLGGRWPALKIYSHWVELWLLEGSVKFGSPLNPKGNGSTGGVAVVAFMAETRQ